MALKPTSKRHQMQITAGTLGRNSGHAFEKYLTTQLNLIDWSKYTLITPLNGHLFTGDPASLLLSYIAQKKKLYGVKKVKAWWLGGLATSGEGDELLDEAGTPIRKCKSDIVIRIEHKEGSLTTGISVKTCNKPTPTNDQLFFTTARAFCKLLRENNIPVSDAAEKALKMFCGDVGLRPIDVPASLKGRLSDPDRWFWEELPEEGRKEWESLLSKKQPDVSLLLLQKAYLSDPHAPEFLLHQTVAYKDIANCPLALFEIEELISLSSKFSGFHVKPYKVRKGRFKGDPSEHLAPRFGFIQMQRGGQKQHPTQLQFNLQAGYFNKLPIEVLVEG